MPIVNGVIYISRKTDQAIKDEINQWTVQLFEFGYLDELGKKIAAFLKFDVHIKSSIYYTAKQFVDANTVDFKNLNFDNFKTFFYLYLLIVSLLSLAKFIYLIIHLTIF